MIAGEDTWAAGEAWIMHGEADYLPNAEACLLWPKELSNLPNKSIVYISGPVTGIPNHNKPQFELAEKMLLKRFQAFNPSRIDWPTGRVLEGLPLWQYFMHHCVKAIPDCDAMLMLPNWQNSKGAMWEHKIAEMLGLPIFYSPVV